MLNIRTEIDCPCLRLAEKVLRLRAENPLQHINLEAPARRFTHDHEL